MWVKPIRSLNAPTRLPQREFLADGDPGRQTSQSVGIMPLGGGLGISSCSQSAPWLRRVLPDLPEALFLAGEGYHSSLLVLFVVAAACERESVTSRYGSLPARRCHLDTIGPGDRLAFPLCHC